MAVTKILTRKGRLDIGINYVLNGDKTEERVLTTHLNCDPGREFRQMLDTKRAVGKEDGVQYYHIIQSFKPGEVTPEQALEIATEFAKEHLPGYETVIGVHVDKEHIHAHLVFNSVNADTGEKYHSNAKSYYRQIRAISDRLCREHGLSVLIQGEPSQAVSYIEWLRRSRGQPTFRSMLEEDLRSAMADANDLGHFFLLMEHMGYEISHGNRLGFRLRGQERFMIPGRKNALFTEDGIRATIQGNLAAIEVGRRPAVLPRPQYRPYQKHPKYTGFLALYVHYLYLLGKTGKRQYPIALIKYKTAIGISAAVCCFSPAGRKKIHDNLEMDTTLFAYLRGHPPKDHSMEYADCRLSLLAAQKGKCAVSGELFLNPDNIVCHMKVPKEQGGQERYSNLALLHRRFLPLLADQDAAALKSICKQLTVTRKQLTKINNLRAAAKLAAI